MEQSIPADKVLQNKMGASFIYLFKFVSATVIALRSQQALGRQQAVQQHQKRYEREVPCAILSASAPQASANNRVVKDFTNKLNSQ